MHATAEHLPQTIPELIERFERAVASDTNRRKRQMWSHWPADLAAPGAFPITIEPEAPMWGDVLGFDMVRYFTDPAEYLRRNLQMSLYRFERWDEDTPLTKRIRVWLGVTLEASLFGAETRYGDGNCPWLAGGHVVTGREAFDRLDQPDFHTSGLMGRAHEFYETLGELLPGDFQVDFPDWERSPFGVCTHLRGTEDMLVDMVQDPVFAHDQVRFMTDCRKEFARRRAGFLDQPIAPGVLLNDEVNGELFPPSLYEQFALPSEIELGEFQGISYWHSCGKVTDFAPMVRRIPGLEVFHVGPRTDAAAVAGPMDGIALQICLDPIADVQRAGEEHIRRRVGHVASACAGKAFTIRADGLHTIDTLDRELAGIDRWLALAREVRGQ